MAYLRRISPFRRLAGDCRACAVGREMVQEVAGPGAREGLTGRERRAEGESLTVFGWASGAMAASAGRSGGGGRTIRAVIALFIPTRARRRSPYRLQLYTEPIIS